MRIWSCIGSIFHNFLNSRYFITWNWVERRVVIYIHLEFIGLKKQQVLFFSFWWSVSICHLFSILFFRNVDTMDVFMLPRDVRCRLISLLLGAVKIERDQHIVSITFSLIFAKRVVLKNFCASWRCLVIEQLLRIAHLVLSKQFSSTSNDEQKLTWIAFDFQFFYRKFVSLYLLSVARMVDCTTDCTCVFMI